MCLYQGSQRFPKVACENLTKGETTGVRGGALDTVPIAREARTQPEDDLVDAQVAVGELEESLKAGAPSPAASKGPRPPSVSFLSCQFNLLTSSLKMNL